jgi:ubiquitin-protein ligase
MATNVTTTGPVSTKQTKKIQTDLEALKAGPPLPFLKNFPELSVEYGQNVLTGAMIGPIGSDYEGGHFNFKVVFPPEYPFTFPGFYFTTKICHPNVSLKDMIACNDQLTTTWAPNIKLSKYLTDMYSLLVKPNYDMPVEGDPRDQKSPEMAREWTQLYAKPSS